MKTKKIKFEAKTVKTKIGSPQPENTTSFFNRAFLSVYKVCAKFPGVLLFLIALFNFGCESPSLKKADSSTPTSNAQEDMKSSLETDLQTMRNASFDYIYVFRRKDGGTLDGEDKKYLKANSPVATNRFILTDENKAVVAGSSYKFEPENLDNLQKRFAIENFSKTENQETPKNSNSNN
jgi:hypothetical protein